MRRLLLSLCWVLVAAPAAAQSSAPVVEYYHLDALGSVRAVTDQNGTVVRRHDYFPFGEEYAAQPAIDPVRFTGKERDRESGLDYFGARYYGSRTGRFTSVDPLMGTELALVDPQRWNRYSYVGNRPAKLVDPDGRGWASKLLKLVVKGGDLAATFSGVVEDAKTVLDSNEGTASRLLALGSLASELLPVSGRDAVEGAQWGASLAVKGDTLNVVRTTTHHIATDKNTISAAAGGPYTQKFEAIFSRAGLTLQDAVNKIPIAGHRGPHPEYNRIVYERLLAALKGLSGGAYNRALERELQEIGRESALSGTALNRLLIGGGS